MEAASFEVKRGHERAVCPKPGRHRHPHFSSTLASMRFTERTTDQGAAGTSVTFTAVIEQSDWD
jgi:hypothetical protein